MTAAPNQPQPSDYDRVQNQILWNQAVAQYLDNQRINTLWDIHFPPANVITVGTSGADHTTLAAAVAAASDGDIIRLITDMPNQASMPNTGDNELNEWWNGINSLTIDFDGHDYDITSGTGEGLAFYDCLRLWIRLGPGGKLEDHRTHGHGANVNGIAISAGCKWTIIEGGDGFGLDSRIKGFPQGIGTLPGHFLGPSPSTAMRAASTEHIWCHNLLLEDIGTGHTDSSAISYYQHAAVADDSVGMPQRWVDLLTQHGLAPNDASWVACITNCVAQNVIFVSGTPSDHNGFILADDWECNQNHTGLSLLPSDYCDGVRRAFSSNCAARNCSGSGLRLYASAPQPFLVRHFTAYECGRDRFQDPAFDDWAGAALSVANDGNDGTYWGGTFANCLAVRCGIGGADDFQTNASNSSPTGTRWLWCRQRDCIGGSGRGFGALNVNPNFQGTSDVTELVPTNDRPALYGSADWADPIDAFGNTRPSPPYLGAFSLAV